MAVTTIGLFIAHSLRTVERARVTAENEWRTLAAIVAHSDDAILAADLSGQVTAFNSGAERLYGWPAEAAIGAVSHDLLRTEHPVQPRDAASGLPREPVRSSVAGY